MKAKANPVIRSESVEGLKICEGRIYFLICQKKVPPRSAGPAVMTQEYKYHVWYDWYVWIWLNKILISNTVPLFLEKNANTDHIIFSRKDDWLRNFIVANPIQGVYDDGTVCMFNKTKVTHLFNNTQSKTFKLNAFVYTHYVLRATLKSNDF